MDGRKIGVAMALWLVAAGAFAQMPPHRRPPGDFDGGRPRPLAPERQNGQGQRDADRPERGDRGERGDGGRMSPEERRQLRRDIHDAGRDLYPERRESPFRR